MQMLATYHTTSSGTCRSELAKRYMTSPRRATLLPQRSCRSLRANSTYWDGVVQIDDGARLTWMRQPHYYMGLYSYTYSAGLVTATVVAENLARDGRRGRAVGQCPEGRQHEEAARPGEDGRSGLRRRGDVRQATDYGVVSWTNAVSDRSCRIAVVNWCLPGDGLVTAFDWARLEWRSVGCGR